MPPNESILIDKHPPGPTHNINMSSMRMKFMKYDFI